MQTDLREMMHSSAPLLLAIALAVGGFALMRMAALWESYLLLFVSFTFMMSGVLMMFGNGHTHHHPVKERITLRAYWRTVARRRAASQDDQ